VIADIADIARDRKGKGKTVTTKDTREHKGRSHPRLREMFAPDILETFS
jgi:hypothetical protein